MPSESKKQTLLQKYEIPVTHLDFDYVKQCKSSKELTRMVEILRSGEEGCYPDLTKCAEDRLRVLKPQSRILRTEDPVIPRSRLNDEELKEYSAPIDEWTRNAKSKDCILSTVQEKSEKGSEIELPPIRKGGKLCSKQKDSTKKTTTSGTSHVAATNYSQWDKYDAEAEILKMDLDIERSKEQAERIDRLKKKKLIEEKKLNSYNKLTPIERENLSEDYRIRGNECFKSKEYDSALEHYTRCIEIQPSLAGYNNRAITNIKLHRFADALSDCNECLSRDHSNLKALLRKAESYLGLGRRLDALKVYEEVNLIQPENAAANKALKMLRNEFGDVAPMHATRLQITEIYDVPKENSIVKVESGKLPEQSKVKPPVEKIDEVPKENSIVKFVPAKLPEQSKVKPPVDYDLSELIKPNKIVKNKFMKKMENLGKSKTEGTAKCAQSRAQQLKLQQTKPEIKLFIGDSETKGRVGKCLIEEL